MSIIPEAYEDLLKNRTFLSLATLGKRGEPHVSSVLFDWDGESIRISMNAIRQKHLNILRDARVALNIVDPNNPFRSMEIRGIAQVEQDPEYHFVEHIGQSYFQKPATLEPGEKRVVIVIEPQKAIAFG